MIKVVNSNSATDIICTWLGKKWYLGCVIPVSLLPLGTGGASSRNLGSILSHSPVDLHGKVIVIFAPARARPRRHRICPSAPFSPRPSQVPSRVEIRPRVNDIFLLPRVIINACIDNARGSLAEQSPPHLRSTGASNFRGDGCPNQESHPNPQIGIAIYFSQCHSPCKSSHPSRPILNV